MTQQKNLILFLDSGDTLVDERTEIRDEHSHVISCHLIPGAQEAVKTLHALGYTIALVADGEVQSFVNIYRDHMLADCFSARAISEAVGASKPDPRMFQTAMDLLGLTEQDKDRIIMVGNNLERDILGANRFGIRSVWQTWTTRYRKYLMTPDEQPDFIIHDPTELVPLAEFLEQQWVRQHALRTAPENPAEMNRI